MSFLNNCLETTNTDTMSVDVSNVKNDGGYALTFMLLLCDWSTTKTYMCMGTYRGDNSSQEPSVAINQGNAIKSVSCDGKKLTINFNRTSYCRLLY